VFEDYSTVKLDNVKWLLNLTDKEFSNIFSGKNKGYVLGNIYGKGVMGYDFVSDCSGASNASYLNHVKIGNWKFWNRSYEEIGEGNFLIFWNKIFTSHGEQYIRRNKIDIKNWNFFDAQVDEIDFLAQKLERI